MLDGDHRGALNLGLELDVRGLPPKDRTTLNVSQALVYLALRSLEPFEADARLSRICRRLLDQKDEPFYAEVAATRIRVAARACSFALAEGLLEQFFDEIERTPTANAYYHMAYASWNYHSRGRRAAEALPHLEMALISVSRGLLPCLHETIARLIAFYRTENEDEVGAQRVLRGAGLQVCEGGASLVDLLTVQPL